MPAPNDLTPEEEAEFANHGVPSAGPGREPLGEAPPAQQGQQSQDDGQQGQSSAQDDGQGQQTQQPRDDSGRFASPQQQGQQQQGQQPADQGQQGQQQQGQQQQGQQPEPGQEGDQGGEPRMVPLAALHQERQQRARLAQRVQLAETRLNAMLSRQAPEQQEAMPDINQDPAGYIVALEQRLQRFEQERAETTQNQQLDSSISADEETFTAIRPDYPQASDYFVQSRAQELLAFHPPAEAQKLMLQEARQIARMAWERGQSAAEVVYGLAQARGYNPGTPQRVPFNQQGQGQSQQQPPQNQGQQPQGQGGPRAADVIASVNRGQQVSRSLSGGTGASPANLNANALLEMDDAEFANWLGEGGDATKRFAAL